VARHPAGTLCRRYRWNALSIGESGPLIVREVAIERAIADAGMSRTMIRSSSGNPPGAQRVRLAIACFHE
jgi:hypothetical protein